MAKDYAKQTHMDFNHPTGQGSGRIKKAAFLFGLLVLLGSGGLYLYQQVDFQEIEKRAIVKLPLKSKVTKKATFEFYTRLPEGNEKPYKQVQKALNQPSKLKPITSALKPMTNKPIVKRARPAPILKAQRKPRTKLSDNNKYHLQVGSFRHFKDADRLKASLLLEGFNVSVSRFTNENITWYRVHVGPYLSLNKAKQIQLSLEKAEHNCLIKQTA